MATWIDLNDYTSVKVGDDGKVEAIATSRDNFDRAIDEASQWQGYHLADVGTFKPSLDGNEWFATVYQ